MAAPESGGDSEQPTTGATIPAAGMWSALFEATRRPDDQLLVLLLDRECADDTTTAD